MPPPRPGTPTRPGPSSAAWPCATPPRPTGTTVWPGRHSPPWRERGGGPVQLAVGGRAHAMAGHADSALARLEELLSLPSRWKPGAVRLTPEFASLRNDPRFVKLLESASK